MLFFLSFIFLFGQLHEAHEITTKIWFQLLNYYVEQIL